MSSVETFDIRHKAVVMAARITYIVLGFAVAAWATLIPYVKLNLNVEEGVLGLLLLCLGLGAICAMPFSGTLASRFGCRKVLALSVPFLLVGLVLLSFIDSIWVFGLTLFLFGVAMGIVDVVMNIQAVFIEKAYNKSMMSGLHGMYSVGGVLGSGAMAAMLTLGLSPIMSCAIISLVGCILIIAYCVKHFLPYGGSSQKSKSSFAMPKGIILLLGILCFLLYMDEGVILDWGALFLIQERGVLPAHAAVAFAVFSATTTLARLVGDSIVEKLGTKLVLIGGGIIGAMGYLLALATDSFGMALVGFALVGVGSANMIPQLFSLSGRQTVVPLHVAIATVTTIGYSGLLVGPALMGFMAEVTGLGAVLALMAVVLIVVGILSTRIKFDEQKT